MAVPPQQDGVLEASDGPGIVLVYKGQGTFRNGDVVEVVRAGHVMFVPAGTAVDICVPEGTGDLALCKAYYSDTTVL